MERGGRLKGVLLLGGYATYMTYLLLSNPGQFAGSA
ncbi:MAG: hypothetical protein ACI9F9_003217 [Candidatus Paceibacteria bacterium]|jgi:hypothetical protein